MEEKPLTIFSKVDNYKSKKKNNESSPCPNPASDSEIFDVEEKQCLFKEVESSERTDFSDNSECSSEKPREENKLRPENKVQPESDMGANENASFIRPPTKEEQETEDQEVLDKLEKSWKKNRKAIFSGAIVSALYFVLAFLVAKTYGTSESETILIMMGLRTSVFIAIAFYAAVYDVRYFKCPLCVPIMIMLCSMILPMGISSVWKALLSGIVVFIVFIPLMLIKLPIGGGDALFGSAATMVLFTGNVVTGCFFSFFAIIIAMIPAIIINAVKQRKLRQKEGKEAVLRFALLPYLAFGYTVASTAATFLSISIS